MTEQSKDTIEREMSPFDKTVSVFIGAILAAYDGKPGLLDKGDLVALRRMSVDEPAAAFWRLLAASEGGGVNRANERQWALVAKSMAMMAPFHHRNDKRPGQALRESGFSASSDLRVSRLLRARGEAFEDYLLSAVRYLASKAVALNWYRFSRLIIFGGSVERNELARDFYSIKS